MKAVFDNKQIDPKSVVLIIDRTGVIGEELSLELAKDYYIILVSNKQINEENNKITQLRFFKKIPQIPKNNYLKIYLVDDGRNITLDIYNSIIKEVKDYETEIFVLSSIRNPNTKNYNQVIKNNKNLKLLVFGDVFDNNYYFEKGASITRFLKSVRSNKKIVVENDGLGMSFPISLRDTLKLIIKASFIRVPQKIVLLFYPSSVTDMTLAHMFQKIDPDVNVDFKDTENANNVYYPSNSVHAIKSYDLFKKLKSLNLDKTQEEENEIDSESNKELGIAKYIFLVIFLMVFVFLLPLLSTYTYSKLGYYQIEKSHEMAKAGNYAKASDKAESANELFAFATKSNQILDKQLSFFEKDYYNNSLESDIKNGSLLSKTMMGFYNALSNLGNINNNDGIKNEEIFSQSIEGLRSSYSLFQQINSNERLIENLGGEIVVSYPLIEKVIDTSEVLPVVFGKEEAMNYLVVFQDNTEIRPGGGVVRALAVVGIEDFQISEFSIKSVDDLGSIENDGRSPSFVEARYLSTDKLTIENSSNSPDGISNSINISTIYGLSENIEVDGVVLVNGNFLRELLKYFGPVEVENVGVVDDENFYDSLITSSDKNAFYADLINKVFDKASSTNTNNYYSLFQVFGNTIFSKDVVVSFRNPEIQNVFSTNNLSGSIIDLKSNQNNLNDYFGLFETSVSKNSVGYYVSKSVSKINNILPDGSMISELSISFKNNSQGSIIGSGNYEAYFQLLLPLGTVINEVSAGGQKKNIITAITDPSVYGEKDLLSLTDFEIRQSVEGGKGIYGFYVEVPDNSTKVIKINYYLPFVISDTQNPTNYLLKIFNQSGARSYPFNLIFKSNSFNVLPENTFSEEIDKDLELNFLISEK